MDNKGPEKHEQIRDGVDWKRQTEDQMWSMRQAWNLGDLQLIKNTTDNFYNWLYWYIPEKDREEIERLETEQKTIRFYYTNEDKAYISEYGQLLDSRKEDLEALVNAHNRILFKKKYTKMYRLLMNMCRQHGIGAEIADTAVVSHDKKKQTFWERRSSIASGITSMKSSATG